MPWKSYKELIVWQKSMALTKEIYVLTEKLPKSELYGLFSQLRRAAVSVPSNIAEGHGRRTTKDFSHFLSVANGSCMEIETQLLLCVQLNMLKEEDISPVLAELNEISRMLTSLILKTKQLKTSNPRAVEARRFPEN